jgi:hypothetical protein
MTVSDVNLPPHNRRDAAQVIVLHMLIGALQWVIWFGGQLLVKEIVRRDPDPVLILFNPHGIPSFLLSMMAIGLIGGVSLALYARYTFPSLRRTLIIEGGVISTILFFAAAWIALPRIQADPVSWMYDPHMTPGGVLALVVMLAWLYLRLWQAKLTAFPTGLVIGGGLFVLALAIFDGWAFVDVIMVPVFAGAYGSVIFPLAALSRISPFINGISSETFMIIVNGVMGAVLGLAWAIILHYSLRYTVWLKTRPEPLDDFTRRAE